MVQLFHGGDYFFMQGIDADAQRHLEGIRQFFAACGSGESPAAFHATGDLPRGVQEQFTSSSGEGMEAHGTAFIHDGAKRFRQHLQRVWVNAAAPQEGGQQLLTVRPVGGLHGTLKLPRDYPIANPEIVSGSRAGRKGVGGQFPRSHPGSSALFPVAVLAAAVTAVDLAVISRGLRHGTTTIDEVARTDTIPEVRQPATITCGDLVFTVGLRVHVDVISGHARLSNTHSEVSRWPLRHVAASCRGRAGFPSGHTKGPEAQRCRVAVGDR